VTIIPVWIICTSNFEVSIDCKQTILVMEDSVATVRVHPTLSTLHFAPSTLHPSPCTLHLTPSPYTLHPTP